MNGYIEPPVLSSFVKFKGIACTFGEQGNAVMTHVAVDKVEKLTKRGQRARRNHISFKGGNRFDSVAENRDRQVE